MKKIILVIASFILVVSLTACSGGGSGAPGVTQNEVSTGPTDTTASEVSTGTTSTSAPVDVTLEGAGQTGAPVTDEQRMTAFSGVSAQLVSVQGLDDAAKNETLARYLASLPEFEAAGYGPGGAWGRFTDGRLLVLDNEDLSQPTTTSPAAPSFPRRMAAAKRVNKVEPVMRASASAYTDIPTSNHLCLYSSTEGRWLATLKQYVEVMNSDGERAYSYSADAANDNATVEALKAIPTDCAVIGLSAHGSDMAIDRSGNRVYSVYTSTPVNAGLEVVYWDMLNSGQLTYYHPIKPLGTVENLMPDQWLHYAFTASFAQAYWAAGGRFTGSKPFVYFNTCRGYNPVSRPLIDAIFAAGASLYAGWTFRSFGEDGPKTASYIFDRLLGANMFPLTQGKPHRPFSWDVLQQEMNDLGLGRTLDDKYGDKEAYGTKGQKYSELKFEAAPSNQFKLLAPSIKYMEIDEKHGSSDSPELTIYGTFGEDQGQVVLIDNSGKNDLPVTSWSKDKITCSLQPDDAGDVVVKVNGNHSNKRRISKWKGKVTFTADRPTLFPGTISCDFKDTVTWDLIIRADIDNYRAMPGQEPVDRTAKFEATRKSNTTYSSEGSWILPDDKGNPVTYMAWSGGGSAKLFDIATDTRSVCDFQFDTGQKQLKMNISFLGEIGSKVITLNPPPPVPIPPSAITTLNSTLYDEENPTGMPPYYRLYVNFDVDWNIEGDQKEKQKDNYAIGGQKFALKFKWDAMTVEHPPWNDAEHGK